MKLGSDLLWLSEADVQALLPMDDALKATQDAFVLTGQNKVQLPAKVYLTFDPFGGDLRTMPAYLKGAEALAGVKIVNSNPTNPSRHLPAVSGLMVLNDPATGLPVAILAAGFLTSQRTGAAGGVAAQWCARPESSTVGLVGCGRQAATQLEALNHLFSLQTVRVWGKTKQEAESFCESHKNNFKMTLVPTESVQKTCEADIVVTTTPVRHPLVQADWIRPGTHINAIGADAPGKQELDSALLKKARVFVDEWQQAAHGGEINRAVAAGEFQKDNLAGELGSVGNRRVPGRTHPDDITIFDSTGLAVQDVAVARVVWKKAQQLKKGQVLQLNGTDSSV